MLSLRAAIVSFALLFVAVDANAVTQFKPRTLVDVCANVNADLSILGTIFGKIQLCLCLSALPGLLQTNPILKSAVLRYGQDSVTSTMNSMISTAADSKQCAYPDHSIPLCTLTDSCGFTCTDGFIPSPIIKPTTCSCPAPLSVCNGICGGFLSCSSPKAKRDTATYPSGYVKRDTATYPSGYVVKRDADWRNSFCPHGHSACGVLSSASGKLDYECVDVRNDLWSCGGCGIPLLPDDPVGTDCTAIPGVSDVACLSSRCVVSRCKAGFFISDNKSTCLPVHGTSEAPFLVANGKGPFKA